MLKRLNLPAKGWGVEGVEGVEESLILNTIGITNRLHLLLKLGELKFTFILTCLSIGSPTFDWRDSIETYCALPQ